MDSRTAWLKLATLHLRIIVADHRAEVAVKRFEQNPSEFNEREYIRWDDELSRLLYEAEELIREVEGATT